MSVPSGYRSRARRRGSIFQDPLRDPCGALPDVSRAVQVPRLPQDDALRTVGVARGTSVNLRLGDAVGVGDDQQDTIAEFTGVMIVTSRPKAPTRRSGRCLGFILPS